MLKFILKRLATIFPMLVIVLTLTFFIVNLAPGSPFSDERQMSPEVESNLNAKYGLDQPKWKQYFRFMARLSGFTYDRNSDEYLWHPYPDFGDSTKYKDRRVNDIIKEALPVSVILGAVAYSIALFFGITAGILSAIKQNSWLDYITTTGTMMGVSVPSFVVGPLLVTILSLTLFWLPPAQMEWALEWEYIRIPTLKTLVLPAFTLSTIYIAFIARMTRSAMIETLRQNYIRTARAKGLPERIVILRHALRGSLLPVVSFSGPALAHLLTGTIVVETIFAVPGLGRYFIDAANNRDHFLLLGITSFFTIAIMIFNLLVDVIYTYVDPRIKIFNA